MELLRLSPSAGESGGSFLAFRREVRKTVDARQAGKPSWPDRCEEDRQRAAGDDGLGTAPISAAASPDSKAPSSFEPLMNTISTAVTWPRRLSGVASAIAVPRMFTLYMSAKPAPASATIDSGKDRDSPKTTTGDAEGPDREEHLLPRSLADLCPSYDTTAAKISAPTDAELRRIPRPTVPRCRIDAA